MRSNLRLINRSTWIAILFVLLLSGIAWAAKKDGLNEAMMGENISGGFGDFGINAKDMFTAESREVLWFASFKGFIGAPQAKLSIDWITPAGEVFKKEKFSTRQSNSRFGWAKLDIQGVDKQALTLPGEWTVRVYWDEELIDTRKFYLGDRKFAQITPRVVEEGIQGAPVAADTAEGHIRLAKVYFAKNQINRVIQELLLAQRAEPTKPEAYLVLGTVYNSTKRPDDAILQFTKAGALGADKNAVRRGLAASYEKLGLINDAIKEYEVVIVSNLSTHEDSKKLDALKALKNKATTT